MALSIVFVRLSEVKPEQESSPPLVPLCSVMHSYSELEGACLPVASASRDVMCSRLVASCLALVSLAWSSFC